MRDISITTRSLQVLLLGSFILSLTGCDKNQFAPLDSRNSAPLVTRISFTPDSIYIDNLTPVNGEYTVTTTVQANAADEDGQSDLAAVAVDILRGNGSVSVGGIALQDDGVTPDAVRGDGVFAGSVQFSLTRAQAGRYQVRVAATDKKGAVSNHLAGQLKLTRRNSSPQLISVVVPDTINLPVSGYITVQFTSSVSDSDGLADIQQVFFQRLEPPDPLQTRFVMKDDGSLDPPVTVGEISVRSGDDIAGDGRFSFLIPLLSTSTRRTSVFSFQAIDTFGDTSSTIQRYFTVR